MNELEIKGLEAKIKEMLDETLEELTERISQLENDFSMAGGLVPTESEEEELPEEGEITEEQIKTLNKAKVLPKAQKELFVEEEQDYDKQTDDEDEAKLMARYQD